MTPIEVENKIEELSTKIKELTEKQLVATERLDNLLNGFTLNRYVDEESKTVIESIIRRFYLKTATDVTAGFSLRPATQHHQLTGTAATTSDTTTAIVDGKFVGQLLIIEGTSDVNTITIKDNANTKMAGDAVLGLNDTLTLMWNDTDWIEISRANS